VVEFDFELELDRCRWTVASLPAAVAEADKADILEVDDEIVCFAVDKMRLISIV
jgi:hypothetical protein